MWIEQDYNLWHYGPIYHLEAYGIFAYVRPGIDGWMTCVGSHNPDNIFDVDFQEYRYQLPSLADAKATAEGIVSDLLPSSHERMEFARLRCIP